MYGRPIVIYNETFSVSYLTKFLAKKFDTSMSKTQLNSILRKDNLTLYTLLSNCAIELNVTATKRLLRHKPIQFSRPIQVIPGLP